MGTSGPYQDLYIYLIRGAVTEDDERGFGPEYLGNWVEEDCSFLFFREPRPNDIQRLLKRAPSLLLMEDYHFTYEEWQGGGLEPFRIEPFVIVPPWETDFEVEPGEIEIILDPGVVFGTGLHPTTRDCLNALVFLRKQERFRNVLDLGAGTGILSLAAANLGAENVLGVDLNPLCVRTARKNVSLNRMEDFVKVVEGDACCFAERGTDLLMANIHYEAMVRVLETGLADMTDWFVLSGLMRSQAGEIKDRMRAYGMEPIREWDHEMTWYTMLLRR